MRPMPAASARAMTASSSAANSGKSRWQWLSTSMRKSPATVGEHQRHIVGGHLDRLVQAEPEDSPTRSKSAISRKPQDGLRAFRAASKAAFEGALCRPSRMKGPYRKRSPPPRSTRPAPANNPKLDPHGEI